MIDISYSGNEPRINQYHLTQRDHKEITFWKRMVDSDQESSVFRGMRSPVFLILLSFVTIATMVWFGPLHGLVIGAAIFLLMPYQPQEIAEAIVEKQIAAKKAGLL